MPLLLAGACSRGDVHLTPWTSVITERVEEKLIPIGRFMAELVAEGDRSASGTAIFLTRTLDHTPPVVAWDADHAKSLQENVVAITLMTCRVRGWLRAIAFQLPRSHRDFGGWSRAMVSSLYVDVTCPGF